MRARAAQTSIFSRIVVFLLDRERISVCLGGRRERIGVLFGLRDRMRRVWGVGRGVCVENAGVHYGESVCGSCVLRCVPSCACSVCRVGQDTTPPSERERATCRRMREGRRRTRCIPQRSCGVSHHVCVCCVCAVHGLWAERAFVERAHFCMRRGVLWLCVCASGRR